MKNRAFTLIELLVVIAIIAILAAILFPVFAQAKVAAKKTQSLSNVKQQILGHMMYIADYDDTFAMSEYGDNGSAGPLVQWYAAIFPYVKNGDRIGTRGVDQSYGADGIFKSPMYPKSRGNASAFEQSGGQSYGVNHGIFGNNYGHPGAGTPANSSFTQTQIDNVADKVAILEKGANFTDEFNYPWFHEWQQFWHSPSLNTPGDATTLRADGSNVYTPGTVAYNDPGPGGRTIGQVVDTDCDSQTNGAWECAAHPRYRYSGTVVAAFTDGHARTFKKGQIRYFQNIWVDRRTQSNNYSWVYGYVRGEWGRGYIY